MKHQGKYGRPAVKVKKKKEKRNKTSEVCVYVCVVGGGRDYSY